MITLIVCIICELAWIFCYGLMLNFFLPMSVFFFAAFGIPFCVSMMFYKKLPFADKVNKILWVLLCSLIFAGVSTLVYDEINRATGEFVDEYEVEVIDSYQRNGGIAYFIDRNGNKAEVNLHDYRIIAIEDDYINEGDVITVREYVGLFRKNYFVLVEDEK
jgi:hypothetical protein